MSPNIASSITGDFLRVVLKVDEGRFQHTGVIAEAARCALLLDVALLGGVTQDAGVTRCSTMRTGWPLADGLIAEINEHPDHDLGRIIQRGNPHLNDVLDDLVASGVWTISRHAPLETHDRFEDVAPGDYFSLSNRLGRVAKGEVQADDNRQAALAALAAVTGLTDVHPFLEIHPDVLAACGDLESLVDFTTKYLQALQEQDIAVRKADSLFPFEKNAY